MTVVQHSLVAAAVLLCASSAQGQQRPVDPLPLVLDDAVARALAASPRLAEAAARHDAAEAVTNQRRAALTPQIAAQAGYARTNHVDEFGIPLPNNQLRVIYPDVPDNYRARLDATWPLYTGGRLQAFERAAERESQATTADLEALRSDIRLEVERAYWTLVGADESLRIVTLSEKQIAAHAANVRNALAVGLVPPSDVLTAAAQVSRQRMLTIQARSAREVAEAELARLIGLGAGTPLIVASPVESESVDSAPEALVARAVAQRKERQALLDRRLSVGERVNAAMAARRPSVFVAGGLDYANPNPRIFPRSATWRSSWDASLNLSWSMFDGGRAKAESAEAIANRRVLDARVAEFEARVSLDIHQRLSEIEAGTAAHEAAVDAQRAATEALRVVKDRYAAGVAISSDVIDAETLVMQVSLDGTRAVVLREIAKARLRRALGQ